MLAYSRHNYFCVGFPMSPRRTTVDKPLISSKRKCQLEFIAETHQPSFTEITAKLIKVEVAYAGLHKIET